MDEVIKLITTPLALAALALLILGSILAAALRSQQSRNPIAKRTVTWIFVTVIGLSVLANVSYLVQVWLFSETLMAGNVRDHDNNPVKFAYVDLQNVGRAATGDDGSFQFSIPYSRQRSSYKIFSSAPGFAAFSDAVPGPRPDPITIVLEKLNATMANSMQITREITITQDVGIPLVGVLVKFINQIGRGFMIDDLSLTVTPPAGDPITLIPVWEKPLVSPFTLYPVHPIPVPVGSSVEMAIIFGEHQQEVSRYLAAIPSSIHPSDFCTKIRELPDGVSQELQHVFDKRFIWKPGGYKVKLVGTVDGQRYELSSSFTITDDQSKALKLVRSDLKNCTGIGIPIDLPDLGSLYQKKGDFANFIQVSVDQSLVEKTK